MSAFDEVFVVLEDELDLAVRKRALADESGYTIRNRHLRAFLRLFSNLLSIVGRTLESRFKTCVIHRSDNRRHEQGMRTD